MTNRKLIVVSLLGVIGVALGIVAVSVTPNQVARAQPVESYCRGYKVCIIKDTIPGSNVQFPFVIDIEEAASGGVESSVNGNGPKTIFLSDGDQYGIEFYGEATITEIPTPGWELVDIDCEGTSDFGYETHGNTLEVYYFSGTPQSNLHCTFINREVRQPLNLGGLFAGQPTPLPTAPPPVAPAATSPAITPPRTGDAGLK